MEREIKFRFWTGEKMRYDDSLCIFADGVIYEKLERDYIIIIVPRASFIPMQYTGLKDKNGKEIYEGDILEAEYKGSSVGKYKNVVVWEPSEHGFGFANSPLWTFENIEIIGNVHENSELLK